MKELHELKETLCRELETYARKKELKAGDLEVVDKLTHTIKNLDKVIENYSDEYSGNYSMARGRGTNAKRDSMGRYSSEYAKDNMGGYSMRRYDMDGYANDGMVAELRELMNDAPDERTRMEFERFIRKMETM